MSVLGDGTSSGPIPRLPPAPPRSGPAAIARAALQELVELAVLASLMLAALGMVAGIGWNYWSVKSETARLEAIVARAGNVETDLAARERQIAEVRANLERIEARAPENLLLKALDTRFDYNPRADGLTPLGAPQAWNQHTVTLPLGALGTVEATRFDRALDVRGKLKDVLSFLADMESWSELVAVRELDIRAAPQRGDALAHFDLTLHQLPRPAEGAK